MRLPHQRVDEGPGGVDIVAVEAEIALARLHPLHPEPVDQPGRRRLAQGRQHGAPAADLHLRPPVQRPGGGVQPLALVRVQLPGLLVQLVAEGPGQGLQGGLQLGQGCVQGLGGLHQPFHRIGGVAFQAVGAVRPLRPGIDLGAGQGQELFGRAARRFVMDAPAPAGPGQGAGRALDLVDRRQRLLARQQVLHPAPQAPAAAGPPPALLMPQKPAAQVRGLQPGQVSGKGGIRGLE